MKTYTFGEIVDKLQPGMMARPTDNSYAEIYCDAVGDIRWKYSEDDFRKKDSIVRCTSDNAKLKWTIIPKEITALEAMQMIMEGKSPIHEAEFGERRSFAINKTMA
ncbi:hypothetical protein ABH14_16880 [Brevibacillus brevis]|uniref:hypothetical protein n=1 Tax=Brevibacillus brevis TaxID=1393 RepID=UPI0019027AD7|nr:hypothetical protein [Brevibacillus brevis]MBH0331451.1 hypothetical protein [Brevibacillus brevis]